MKVKTKKEMTGSLGSSTVYLINYHVREVRSIFAVQFRIFDCTF